MNAAVTLLSPEDVAHLVRQVLWMAVGIGLWLGWVLQRSHFCTMGAISDWLLFRDATRASQWLLTVLLSALGFSCFYALDWINPGDTVYAQPHVSWLTLVVGGGLFGVGMVLASGCPTKNLVRLAGGSLKALVVLLFMAMSALATLRGLPGLWRTQTLDTFKVEAGPPIFFAQWLSKASGWNPASCALVLALVLLCLGGVWMARNPAFWGQRRWAVSLWITLVLMALWWLSGVWGFVPEHPATLERAFVATGSGRAEGMSFTAPVAQWLDGWMYAADGGKRITMGMALVPGVLLGAGLAAWRSGQWRWEGFTQTADLGRHVVGAVLMGFGGVSAMGCTFGQGITGLSTLNWGSVLAVLAMVAGAVLALRVQWWLAARQA